MFAVIPWIITPSAGGITLEQCAEMELAVVLGSRSFLYCFVFVPICNLAGGFVL